MVSKSALVAAALSLTVNAHLFISSPVPIEGTNIKSPLDASGSNFPCHGVTLPTSGGENMAAGSSQLLKFDNGNGENYAVHGGGSCQLSLTYETDAAKQKDPKNWFVIYSIEGGCPSNTYQNLVPGTWTGPQGTYTGALQCTDPKANGVDCINQFNFTIPKGVKNGHAILAWTWFNTVGNREMYMNCVNAQITGGDSSEMSKFPSMFVANMASVNQCPTVESTNVKFPYPGQYVMTKTPSGMAAKTAKTFPIAQPTGPSCAQNGAPVGGADSGGSGGSSAASPSAPAAAPSASPSGSLPYGQPQATKGGSGGAQVTVTTMETITSGSAGFIGSGAPSAPASSAPASAPAAASSAPPAPSSAPAASSAPPAASSAPAAPVPSGSTGGSSGSCANGKVSCPTPGSVICIGNTQFGLCDIDNCALPQALAAGTHCSNGAIMRRSHVRRHAPKHPHGWPRF